MFTIMKCRQCRTVKLVTDRAAGEAVRCPKCSNMVRTVDPAEIGRAIVECGACGARALVPVAKLGLSLTCPRCRNEIDTRLAMGGIGQQSHEAPVEAGASTATPPHPASSPAESPPETETSAPRPSSPSPAASATPQGQKEVASVREGQRTSLQQELRGRREEETSAPVESPSASPPAKASPRREGTILRFFHRGGKIKRYGLIQSGQEQIWFHLNHFREKTTRSMLPKGTPVSFLLRPSQTYPDKLEADDIIILQKPRGTAGRGTDADAGRSKSPLYEWAYMPNEESAYEALARLALPEDWGNNLGEQNGYPYPILRRYIHNTFVRLQHEGKVVEITGPSGKALAAFNTGLVDRRYEPIFALFEPNRIADQTGTQWCFRSFCIAGEKEGKDLSRYFNPLPEPANYCRNPAELIYDPQAGFPHIDYDHILLDNIARLPVKFLEQCCGVAHMESCRVGKELDTEALRRLIEKHTEILHTMKRRLKSEVELAIKKTMTNFRLAIPQYNTKFHRMELLLPLALAKAESPDMALVVEKTTAGHYLAHTILSLDWAYSNARLVCRMDENWLNIQKLREIYS